MQPYNHLNRDSKDLINVIFWDIFIATGVTHSSSLYEYAGGLRIEATAEQTQRLQQLMTSLSQYGFITYEMANSTGSHFYIQNVNVPLLMQHKDLIISNFVQLYPQSASSSSSSSSYASPASAYSQPASSSSQAPYYPQQASGSSQASYYPQQASSSSQAPYYPQQASSSSQAPYYPQQASGSSQAPYYPQQASGSSQASYYPQQASGSSQASYYPQQASGSSYAPASGPSYAPASGPSYAPANGSSYAPASGPSYAPSAQAPAVVEYPNYPAPAFDNYAYPQPASNPAPAPSAPPYHHIAARQSQPEQVIPHYRDTSSALQQKLHDCLAVMLLLMGAENQINLGRTPEGDLIIRARGGANVPTLQQWVQLNAIINVLKRCGVEYECTNVGAVTNRGELRSTPGIRIFNIEPRLEVRLDRTKVIDLMVQCAYPLTEAQAMAQGWREYNPLRDHYTKNFIKIGDKDFTPPAHLASIVAALNSAKAAPLNDPKLQEALAKKSMHFKPLETYFVTNAAAPAHSPARPAPTPAPVPSAPVRPDPVPTPVPSAQAILPHAKSPVGSNPNLLLAPPALVRRNMKLTTKIPFANLDEKNRARLIKYDRRIQNYWDKFNPELQAHIVACVNIDLPNRLALPAANDIAALENASVRCGINLEAAQIPVRFPNALHIKADEKGHVSEGQVYELKVILNDYESKPVHRRKLQDPLELGKTLEFDQLLPARQAKEKVNARAPQLKH